jgi:hypothetical protein
MGGKHKIERDLLENFSANQGRANGDFNSGSVLVLKSKGGTEKK